MPTSIWGRTTEIQDDPATQRRFESRSGPTTGSFDNCDSGMNGNLLRSLSIVDSTARIDHSLLQIVPFDANNPRNRRHQRFWSSRSYIDIVVPNRAVAVERRPSILPLGTKYRLRVRPISFRGSARYQGPCERQEMSDIAKRR
jgi:hypothetical protein